MFSPKPKPDSYLARYRLLAPTASVRVSPLCFGAMNLGTAWEAGMGTMDKETGFKMLDWYYDQGGNFIDTSNNYQEEESEIWLGEWMAKRGNRDNIVLATKFSSNYQSSNKGPQVNFVGNSVKSLHMSVEASLKKLQTTYIDLLYVHWWDFTMTVEEVMQALDVVVKQGKVLYLGISDAPAWVVAKANQYARDHGMRQFSVYQGRYNISNRDMEREIFPMCESEGMGIAPWGALGQGHYKSKELIAEMEKSGDKGRNFRPPTEQDKNISAVLEKMSKETGISMTGVALNWAIHKHPYTFPIIGGRKISHLEDNVKSIGKPLDEKYVQELENSYEFDVGFPSNFVTRDQRSFFMLNSVSYNDYLKPPKAISLDDQD